MLVMGFTCEVEHLERLKSTSEKVTRSQLN
jgi:hypothetical protein